MRSICQQLSGTAALDDADSVAALEHAQAAQILRSGPDGHYRFTHDLYRQCVADSLSPARRALLHGRLARNLVSAGGVPARVADHFEKANLDHDAAPWSCVRPTLRPRCSTSTPR